jgi:hypothetical protein
MRDQRCLCLRSIILVLVLLIQGLCSPRTDQSFNIFSESGCSSSSQRTSCLNVNAREHRVNNFLQEQNVAHPSYTSQYYCMRLRNRIKDRVINYKYCQTWSPRTYIIAEENLRIDCRPQTGIIGDYDHIQGLACGELIN